MTDKELDAIEARVDAVTVADADWTEQGEHRCIFSEDCARLVLDMRKLRNAASLALLLLERPGTNNNTEDMVAAALRAALK